MGETAAYQRLQSTSEEGDYQCLPSDEEEEVYYRVHLAIFIVYGNWLTYRSSMNSFTVPTMYCCFSFF